VSGHDSKENFPKQPACLSLRANRLFFSERHQQSKEGRKSVAMIAWRKVGIFKGQYMMTEKITVRLQQPIFPPRLAPYWCNGCGKLVTMISAEEAALIARVSAEAIHRKIETRCLHFIRTSSGAHFVCLNSLASKN
jgi:hypothetical protein